MEIISFQKFQASRNYTIQFFLMCLMIQGWESSQIWIVDRYIFKENPVSSLANLVLAELSRVEPGWAGLSQVEPNQARPGRGVVFTYLTWFQPLEKRKTPRKGFFSRILNLSWFWRKICWYSNSWSRRNITEGNSKVFTNPKFCEMPTLEIFSS